MYVYFSWINNSSVIIVEITSSFKIVLLNISYIVETIIWRIVLCIESSKILKVTSFNSILLGRDPISKGFS